MKNIEVFFGNNENQKKLISNIFKKYFPDKEINFR